MSAQLYVQLVRDFNPDGQLRQYPGSPAIAHFVLRDTDRLRAYELHPTEIGLLRDHFAGVKRGVSIEEADGFSGLPKVLPPPPRRGLVHIDPPYEIIPEVAPVLFERLAAVLASKPEAIVVFEHPGELELHPAGWTQLKRLGKGARQPTVGFFRRAAAGPPT